MKLRINIQQKDSLKCENCGVELTPEKVYLREIEGKPHYFCCEECAEEFEHKGCSC
jgi:predicted sulfurtransferase